MLTYSATAKSRALAVVQHHCHNSSAPAVATPPQLPLSHTTVPCLSRNSMRHPLHLHSRRATVPPLQRRPSSDGKALLLVPRIA